MKILNICIIVVLFNLLISNVLSINNPGKIDQLFELDEVDTYIFEEDFLEKWGDLYSDEMFIRDLQIKSAREFKDFVIGFAEGLEITLSGDSKECFATVRHSFKDFEMGFKLIEDGFQRKSIGSLTVGIQDIGAALQEIAHAFEVCNVEKLVREIKSISDDLASGKTGIIKLIIKESIIIFKNHRDLTSDFRNSVNTWKSRNFRSCGKSVGHIIGILIE